MKYVQVFLLCVWSFHACGQVSPIVKFIDKTILNADMLVNIDSFGTIYSIDGDTFIKTQGTQNIYFSSIQLGNITSANVFNPLKFPVFYENFNTVVILDNRLAEITRVNFNDLTPFRLVTKISAGFDNAIWIYNQNTQQMELFDYLNRKTRIKSLPISGEVISIASNFNFCFVLTNKALITYNYLGNVVSKIPVSGFMAVNEFNDNLILRKNNHLYFKRANSIELQPLKLPELLINQFFVTDETLYIYDGEILHRFHLKLN